MDMKHLFHVHQMKHSEKEKHSQNSLMSLTTFLMKRNNLDTKHKSCKRVLKDTNEYKFVLAMVL